MRYCLLAALLFTTLLGACAPAQTPTPQAEISLPPTPLPTAMPIEPTAPPAPTATPTEIPTVAPSPTPISIEDWAQSNSPDPAQLQSVLATYSKSMGLPLENIQTEVQMRSGVNGLFGVLVDKGTDVPFFITKTDENGQLTWQEATLDNVAQERGMRFGALLNLNRDFRDITLNNFGTGNAYIDWNLVESQKGVWDFSDPGYNIDTAHENGLSIMANLIWGKNIADWVRQDPDLQSVMRDYITKVMTHYKDKVTIWNVYNEAKWHGDGDIFWNRLGGIEAVRDAFATARAANPNAKLLYNDYVDLDNTNNQDRFPIFESVISQIHQDGNLDGIAIQVISRTESFDPAKLRAVLDALSQYNLPIYVEEFSILINGENTPQNMAKQAEVAGEVMKILKEYKNVVEVIAFPLEDRIANMIYLPNSNSGLWLKTDDGYVPKPIVYRMMEALASDVEK